MIGLLSGLAAFLAMLAMDPPAAMPEAAWKVAALAVLMSTWWVWEAIPIAATALMPVALLPILGVADVGQATAPYANPLVFLFLGGFCLAVAMERWDLHRRLALLVLSLVGTRQDRVIGGFMVATAAMSMWVSNTATATMMLPIAVTVCATLRNEKDGFSSRPFTIAMLLAIAYGANVGGMATLIGTPPNALFAGYMREAHGVEIGFGQWMLVGLPFSILLLGLAWLVLTRWSFPVRHEQAAGADTAIRAQLTALGSMTRGEKLVLAVFITTAAAWIFRPLLESLTGLALSDAAIAVLAAIALFSIPVRPTERIFILDWSHTAKIPWGVLILVGGGLSLGSAVGSSGLSAWLAGALEPLTVFPAWVVVAAVASVVIGISHIASNTATAATFLPLAGSFALTAGMDPSVLAAPVALAASCAFMMPVATPPNAIVFATGEMTVADMVRAGFWTNVISLALLVVFSVVLLPLVF